MVDDNPQDLVHDVVAEAVFGGHPIGRPVIGRAEVISSVSRKALTAYHRAAYAADNIVVAAAGNVTHDRVVELLGARLPATESNRAPRPQAVRTRAAARLPLPAEGDGAVPRLPGRARDLAPRRAPLRRLAARLDHRRLRVVAALPGDPREARDGLLGLQLRLPVLRLGPDRALRRHARGEPRRLLRDRRPRARGRRGRQRPAGGARARPGEPEGPDAALARVDVEPDEPAREVADQRHRAALARRARRPGRGGHGRRRRRARRRPAPARPALRRRDRSVASRASAPRSSASTRRWWSAPQREGHPLRPPRQGRLRARRRRSRRPGTSSSSRPTTPRSPSTSRGPRRSRRTSGWRSRTASRS